ncbi:MAG: thiamine ABC transporter substrate-binding protein [Candidatus Thermoplasmatota archaeon]|nr:thiamine ABC transporter substrate-binding protein [Candidatus Thermoplasmatota archaeon]
MSRGRTGSISGRTIAILVVIGILITAWVLGTVYILYLLGREEEPDLVIYTYESFQSYGLGPAVIPKFEELHDVKVKVVTPGDVGTVLGMVNVEKERPKADIILGVDNSMLFKAVRQDLLEPYVPVNIERLDPTMDFDPGHYVVPFDYGYIAMICNGEMMRQRGLDIPGDLLDLADEEYDGQILLLDPATSSTGCSFMIWAASVAGENHSSFFRDLADNANGRVLGSWDAMYDAWGDGEAPIAISYGLDTAYEVMSTGTNNTITVVPDHQGYRQIEGAGMVKGAPHPELARKFLDFILTDEFQSEVYNNYMLPVVLGVPIDPDFEEYGESALVHVEPTTTEVMDNYEDWYQAWREAFF